MAAQARLSRWDPGAEVSVWVVGWEHECCGEELRTGGTATMHVEREDAPLAFDAGGMLADPVRVDGWELHHEEGEQPPAVHGTVSGLRRLDGRHAPERPGSRVHVPVPGSGRLTAVDRTARSGEESPSGYLVTLRLTGP